MATTGSITIFESRRHLILLCVLIFAWFNPFYDGVLKALEASTLKATESLVLLEELYLMTKAAASVKIPIISGTFGGASDSLSKINEYLGLATIALMLNVLLVKMTHFKVVLIGLGVVWAYSFYGKRRALAHKILLIGLFANPGMSLYTQVTVALTKHIHLDTKTSLHAQLQLIHQDYQRKEQARQKKMTARKAAQLAKNKKKGRDHLTIIQKAEDAVVDKVGKAGEHIAEDFALTKKSIRLAVKNLRPLIIEYLTYTFFVNILLPLSHLAFSYFMLLRIFDTNKQRVLTQIESLQSIAKSKIEKL